MVRPSNPTSTKQLKKSSSKVRKPVCKPTTKGAKKSKTYSPVDIVNFTMPSQVDVKKKKLTAVQQYRDAVFRNFVDSSEETSEYSIEARRKRMRETDNSVSFVNQTLKSLKGKKLSDKAEIIVVETDKMLSEVSTDLSDSDVVVSDVPMEQLRASEHSSMENAECSENSELYSESPEEFVNSDIELLNTSNYGNGDRSPKARAPKNFAARTHGDTTVLVMTHPFEVCFRGKAKIHALLGSCMCMGYEIQQNQKPVDIYSPSCNSFLTISSITGVTKSRAIEMVKKDLKIKRQKVLKLLRDIEKLPVADCVLLSFSELISPVSNYLTTVPNFENLFKQTQNVSYSFCRTTDCDTLFVSASQQYESVVSEWTNKIQEGKNPIVMVVGGKNSGKSTLNRILMNAALNISEAVAFLDCDVGQPEFTPSGFVSLHQIREPVLGPPFTHQRTTDHMCFYGEITPSRGLTRFIKSVELVHSEHVRSKTKLPLVINTLGWNEGLGIKIIIDLIHMMKPTLIIQLSSLYDYKNFPILTYDFLTSTQGWLYNLPHTDLTVSDNNHCNFDNQALFIIDSEVPAKYRFPLKAEQYRELALMSYLNSTLDAGKKILQDVPFRISFKNVIIHDCQNPGYYSQILYAFNASVVGLCQVDMAVAFSREETELKFVRETPVCLCEGLGIIRAIDVKNEYIYLITPLPIEKLAKINCLIKSALQLPDAFLLQQTSQSKKPYIGTINKTVGSSALDARSKMPRKQYLHKGEERIT